MQRANRPPQNRQMIKYAARIQLSGRVLTCFLACLIPQILPWLLRLTPIPSGEINLLVMDVYLFNIPFSLPVTLMTFIASIFVTNPMRVKLSAFFLALNRTPDAMPSPITICDCFGPGYLRLVRGMLLRTAMVLVWTAVPLCIGALIPGAWTITEIQGYRAVQISDWAYVFILIALILNIYRSLMYAMVPYLLADDPSIGPVEAMRSSAALTRGRLWELFMLDLSFFGWVFLASITLFIGAIYVYPYIETTMAAYYIAFSEPMPWERRTPDAN